MVTHVVGAKKNVHQLIVDIISDSQVDTAPLFAQFLQESDAELVQIGLIGYTVHVQPGIEPGLYQLIQSPDKEVRIKAVKLMCRDIRYMNEQTVTDFMNHKDWEIRAMAAKAIGSLKLHSYIPLLKKAVGDANWWVRHHSARSLAQLEVEGFAALCEILQEERNGHKSEMAHQVIQEELEKEKLVLQGATATEKLVQYNEKLHLYRKSYRKTISTVQALER
ncbi:HEAT repeat domain-containing protein [Brevibacillus sp. FIR094]|uniref:HEAT repeat domain-containing protein n=1 Tax=Brevibacillus sp. FIR094 TaxID=3134809 RepID=UPI003D1C3262